MANEDPRDLNKLWQEQATEDVRMAIEDIRARAQKMKKKGDRRNLREYVAAAVVVAIAVVLGAREKNTTVLIGGALLVLGTVYVVYHLYLYGTVRSMPSDLGLQDCFDFHRAELVRQRDLLRSVWWWYMAPFVPGWAFILIGRAAERPDRRWPAFGVAVGCAVMCVVVGKLNTRVARKMQGRIDELDQTHTSA